MTNGELFLVENPTVETKINGSCVWIYFDGVNHYTMPVEWWDKEIGLFDDIRQEIDNQYKWLMQTDHTLYDIDIAFDAIKSLLDKHTSGKELKQELK